MSVELDPNVILSSLLGGFITILGSVAVASLYVRNQNRIERRRRVNERIIKTYFDEGIFPVEAAIAEYGTNATFALGDARTRVGRYLQSNPKSAERLENGFAEISRRPIVADLINRNFNLATKSLPILQRFGMPLCAAIRLTLRLYSNILPEILDVKNILRQIEGYPFEETMQSLSAMSSMLAATELYLETRLEGLKEYLWERDYEHYQSFLEITKEPNYESFLKELNQYCKYLDAWMKALVSPKGEDREKTSIELSKWVTKQIELNPFTGKVLSTLA